MKEISHILTYVHVSIIRQGMFFLILIRIAADISSTIVLMELGNI